MQLQQNRFGFMQSWIWRLNSSSSDLFFCLSALPSLAWISFPYGTQDGSQSLQAYNSTLYFHQATSVETKKSVSIQLQRKSTCLVSFLWLGLCTLNQLLREGNGMLSLDRSKAHAHQWSGSLEEVVSMDSLKERKGLMEGTNWKECPPVSSTSNHTK